MCIRDRSITAFSGSGTSYQATFTPTDDSNADGVISVSSPKFTDAAGNANNAASNTVTLTVDTVEPTISITSNVSELKVGETATLTFTLSESSTDFTADDISATGGSITAFSGSGTSYQATFTPTDDSNTDGVISVSSPTFSDAAGNTNNAASNTVTLSVDTVEPTINITSDVTALKVGETATLTTVSYTHLTLPTKRIV